jgi:hypothetical protein
MSTLSISTPRVSPDSDIDSRFDALVRGESPTSLEGRAGVDFATVFDLDYGQPIDDALPDAEPVAQPRAARRVRLAEVKPRPAPSAVRLTRRGRTVLVLTFLAIALALMIPMGGWATATLTGGTPEPVRIVEVQPGDTLYGIAGDLAEPGQVREMVLRIQQLNSLPGGQIAEGQKLAVPRG